MADTTNCCLVILVNPGYDLDQLKKAVEDVASTSTNAVEILYKYRSKESKDSVKEIRVRWSRNDKQLFPKETILTEDNCEPVLRMMALGAGKDVFDVKLESKKVVG